MNLDLPVSDQAKAVLTAAKEKNDAAPVFAGMSTLSNLSAVDLALVKNWLKKHLNGNINLNDFNSAITQARRDARDESHPDRLTHAINVTGCGIPDLADRCVEALMKSGGDLNLFVRNGSLVRIKRDEHDRAFINDVIHRDLRHVLERVASFCRDGNQGRVRVPVPGEVVEDLLAYDNYSFLRSLQGIVEVPVVRPDGSVLVTPGYDAATHLYYAPVADLVIPRIPRQPCLSDVKAAVQSIWSVVSDFPFVGGLKGPSFANFLGLMLTLPARPVISGPTPLALIDAPEAGTGKGLLVALFTVIATGRNQGITTAPSNEDEWGKKITAMLLDGTGVIILDNLAARLDSAKLAAALTATEWTDRVMGLSKQVRIPQRATWVATGNNIQLGGDMARRCYRVHLDAGMADPWKRKDFKIPNLLEHVTEHRGELLAALLTIISGWFSANQPQFSVPTLGSFNSWCSTIGNMLSYAGVEGFLSNMSEVQEADEEKAQWAAFLERAYEIIGGVEFQARELHEKAMHDEALRSLLPDEFAEGDNLPRRMGKALGKRRDVRHGRHGVMVSSTGRTRGGLGTWVIRMTL